MNGTEYHKSKTAIITGGAQGIGKVVARELLKSGINVCILDFDTEAGQEAAAELASEGNITFIPCDVSDEEEIRNSIQKAIKAYNRIDFLINNAGIGINKPVTELSLEEWNKVLSINLTSQFLTAKYSIPYLKKNGGSIINICSTRAFMSERDTEAYSASKGGVYALTHSLAISLGPQIRVNSISPGWIDVTGHQKKSKRKTAVLSEADHVQHPAGRVGKAEDIANMIIFLLSPQNSFITGQDFIIDGGMTRKMIYI